MEERREISRVEYKTNGVVVICDTQEKIYVDVKDISPLGMGICVPEGHEGLLGKQVIIVAETLIMYAEVSREEKQEDGSTFIGVHAIKFTDDVLQSKAPWATISTFFPETNSGVKTSWIKEPLRAYKCSRLSAPSTA